MGQKRKRAYVERAERWPVTLHGFALGPKRDSDITVADLSYGGCRLASSDAFKKGETVELRIIRRGVSQAKIRWAEGKSAGAQFLN